MALSVPSGVGLGDDRGSGPARLLAEIRFTCILVAQLSHSPEVSQFRLIVSSPR